MFIYLFQHTLLKLANWLGKENVPKNEKRTSDLTPELAKSRGTFRSFAWDVMHQKPMEPFVADLNRFDQSELKSFLDNIADQNFESIREHYGDDAVKGFGYSFSSKESQGRNL